MGSSDEEGALGEDALKKVAPTPDFEVVEALARASSFPPHRRVSSAQMCSGHRSTSGFSYRVWPLFLQELP